MSTPPLCGTTARLKPPRDRLAWGGELIAVVIIPLLAKAAITGAEPTSITPKASALPPEEIGDEQSHEPEGLPKVASTAFFLIFLFLFSIGISYFFKYYVFSRDRKECCCEKQSQSAVSPETMGLKENTSRQTTPENDNGIKTGLYANIFARSYDSDEEEIRQLELEAQKAMESDTEVRTGKKPAKATRTSILKALETANLSLKLTIHSSATDTAKSNGTTVKDVAEVWMDKALNKEDKNSNVIPDMTVVDMSVDSKVSNHYHSSNNHNGLTSVLVHRDPSPVPSARTSLDLPDVETKGSSAEGHDKKSINDTPRTDGTMLSARPRSGQYPEDWDGYSADFESISLYSEISNLTEFQKSMDGRSVRATTAKRKRPMPHHDDVSPSKEGDINQNSFAGHSGRHHNAKPETQDGMTDATWADKTSRIDSSKAHNKEHDKDIRSDANPTLAAESGQSPQTSAPPNPLQDCRAKNGSDDEKPGTPESGTPLLNDEVAAEPKQLDIASGELKDPEDLPQQSGGNGPANIFAKYANTAKLPNKHILGETDGGKRPTTSAGEKTVGKGNRETKQKSPGLSQNKGDIDKEMKGSAASKPSAGKPRSKTAISRKLPSQKKGNVKR